MSGLKLLLLRAPEEKPRSKLKATGKIHGFREIQSSTPSPENTSQNSQPIQIASPTA